ncbi:hypothetical protein [Iodidimonas nitroreducens]|uniref:hypothetical protein n=1 Tax=Iodidimonas nitroreducens TaxID=1236968 RepID=UPI0028D2A814|nr:hypothetical protein [Iodidimonas nitroreducens]
MSTAMAINAAIAPIVHRNALKINHMTILLPREFDPRLNNQKGAMGASMKNPSIICIK